MGHQTDAHGRPAASLHCLITGTLGVSVTVLLLIHIILQGVTACVLVGGYKNLRALKIEATRELMSVNPSVAVCCITGTELSVQLSVVTMLV